MQGLAFFMRLLRRASTAMTGNSVLRLLLVIADKKNGTIFRW